MPDFKVEIETRERSSNGRQISARRFGAEALADRAHELQAAVNTVIASLENVLDHRLESSLRVGELEVAFNVAFAPEEGTYLCLSAADATFAVKLSLTPAGRPLPAGSASSSPDVTD